VTAPDVIVFDVDGVLVEVSASYREAIRETVRNFTGDLVSNELIQKYKNQGGWNNDWELSYKFILDRGRKVEYQEVIDEFNRVFFGNNGDGLILREQWLPRTGLFTELQKHSALAIFTGRVGYELTPTLNRFAPEVRFDPVITADDVKNQKPAPDGLNIIKDRYPNKTLWYLGDTVDDARAAQGAGVAFIGVAVKTSPRYTELVEVLKHHGAFTVLEEVNEVLSLVSGAGAQSTPALRSADEI
jgi:HAD superfamily hydrolase (TIGR01548 family)